MIPTRDRVAGCFLGVAIGDGLGMPVETYDAGRIARQFGRITDYRPAAGHPWYDGSPTGTTTDDWQLTRAVAEGILDGGGLDLDAIAARHVAAFREGVRGWGPTTREAVVALAAGVPRDACGKTDRPDRGTGNGVSIKVAAVGVYLAATNPRCEEPAWGEAMNFLADLAKLTHHTGLGVASGLCQAVAVFGCLTSEPGEFQVPPFIESLVAAAHRGGQHMPGDAGPDDLAGRLRRLHEHERYDTRRIISEFDGSSHVLHSLPLTYLFFVKGPHSIESLYDCVNAGGDADSNGSMLACLLGALHGTAIFPPHLVDGLPCRDAVLDVADRFCDFLKLPR